MDTAKLAEYVRLLSEELGEGWEIWGILEIGSFAKGEAVSSSDIDTRVYVSSPQEYIWQLAGSRQSDAQIQEAEDMFALFLDTAPSLPRRQVEWFSWNASVMDRISSVLGHTVEFGVADVRIAAYELSQLETRASVEHQLLLQSTILYDPQGILAAFREQIRGKRFAALDVWYQQRYLEALPFELYAHLEPHPMDVLKLQKSRQLQWVKWAVRALRDAVSARTYLDTGSMVYKKEEVLAYYAQRLTPEEFALVQRVYAWKTDPELREAQIAAFVACPEEQFEEFRRCTEWLEKIINNIFFI